MWKMNNLSRRVFALVLTLAMFVGLLPVLGVTAVTVQNTAADPSSFDSWQDFFGTGRISTEHAGGIWTDKSVFTSTSAQDRFGDLVSVGADNFLVALSALGSNSTMVGQGSTATDTMFVLDISGSMSSSDINALVQSTNNSIRTLLALNPNNRVGVVLYSTDAHILLPLDSYNGVADANGTLQYIKRGKEVSSFFGSYVDNSVIVSYPGLTNSDGDAVSTEVELEGGTYIQMGLWAAWQQMLNAPKDPSVPRTPAMVLMSDGAPTYVTNTFNDVANGSLYGQGNSSLDGDGFVTQLTAAYVKAMMAEHYGTNSYFYTMGLGVSNATNSEIAIAVLDSRADAQTDGITAYWDAYETGKTSMNVTVGRRSGNTGSIKVSVPYVEAVAGKRNYVDKYFTAADASNLATAFQSIVNEISLQAGYYPTRLDDNSPNYGGYITFVDELGVGMEVKQIKGILIGSVLYTGEALAKALANGDFGTKDAPTLLGDNMVWAVMDRMGISNTQAWALLENAWADGQLAYSNSSYSNYIGFYADADGNFLSFWDQDDTVAPEGAVFKTKAYGMLGSTTSAQTTLASDMMYITIRVSTEIATGNQVVHLRIPAALLPVVTYQISLDGSTDPDNATAIHLDYKSANPISLLYEVGVRSDITDYNIAEILNAAAGQTYVPEADGTYKLYQSSWYSDVTAGGNMEPADDLLKDTTDNNFAYSYFEPGEENEHYYFVGNSPVYDAQGNQVPAGNRLSANATYYFRHRYFQRTGTGDAARVVYQMEELSAEALAEATNAGQSYWYVPNGVLHHNDHGHDLMKGADAQGNYNASGNPTGTLHWVRNQIVDAVLNAPDGRHYELNYLGNNGVLTYAPATGIKLSKVIDDGTYPEDNFSFLIRLEGAALAQEYTVVTRKLDGTESSATVRVADNTMTVSMKAGQTLFITGLPANTRYTITEMEGDVYQVASASNASGVLVANKLSEVTFTNERIVYSSLTVLKDVEYFKGATAGTTARFPVTVTFTHADGHAHDLPAVPAGVSRIAEGTYSFQLSDGGSMTFSVPVGVTYTVVEGELNTAESGFSMDANRSLNLTGRIALSGNTAVLVNNYVPKDLVADGVVTFDISKTLEGKAWGNGDVFDFQLQVYDAATRSWVPVVGYEKISISAASTEVDADTKKTGAVELNYTFTKVGSYDFRIVELVPDLEDQQIGMTYDRSRFDFEIVVADNGAGELVVSSVNRILNVTVDKTAQDVWNVGASFTNTYVDGSTKLTFNPVKNLTNVTDPANPSDMDLKDGQFVFTLYTTGSDYDIASALREERYNGANGDIVFGTITYTAEGRNFYVIKETSVDGKGVTVDDTEYRIEVVVSRTAANTLQITAIYVNGVSAQIPADGVLKEQPGVFDFAFNNDYAAAPATNVVISGTKTLNGRHKAMEAGEFTFTMVGNNVNASASNDANGAFSFPAMSYNAPGTYTYLITENVPAAAVNGVYHGVTYDPTQYTVVVTVTDNGEGQLVANYTVNGLANLPIAFHNSYSAASDTIVLGGVKKLEGIRELKAGEFKFQLWYGDRLVETVTNNADGTFSFRVLTATRAGTNVFTIREVKESLGGIVYDEHVETVTITVTDDSMGNLTATADKNNEQIVFTNRYVPQSVKVALGGVKILTGAALEPDSFNFTLTGNGVNETVSNGLHGVFTFSEIEYTEVGEYTYTIAEVIPADAVAGVYKGVTYDQVTYTVTVKVTDDKNGKLVAEVSSVDSTGAAAEVQFFNIYNANGATVAINVGTKTLDGRDLKDGEFTFELRNEAGELVEAVTNGADGGIVFSNLTFNTAGTYVYTIVEDASAAAEGVDYDETVYTVTVVVTDNGEGQLEANVSYQKDGEDYTGNPDFANTYTAEEVDFSVMLEKILNDIDDAGRGLSGFIFKVVNKADNSFEEFTTDATGLIELVFHFTQANIGQEYDYEISEVNTGEDGMTYDETVYELHIAVAQDAQSGQLVVEATVNEQPVSGSLQFANTYDQDLPADTADEFNLGGLLALMVLSMMGIAAVVVMDKKQQF